MVDKKSRDSEHLKKSHKKDVSVDAKILIALKRKQPQTRDDLIKSGINRSSFFKNIPLLKKRSIIKETDKGYAWYDFVERPSRWSQIKKKFAEAGAKFVEITIKKAIEDGVGPYGDYEWSFNTEYSANVIIVLRNAPDLVKIAKEFDIHFRDEFEKKEFIGVILTQDPISFMDRFTWQNELYKIWDTEDIMDGYDFSYRIGYLEWLRK